MRLLGACSDPDPGAVRKRSQADRLGAGGAQSSSQLPGLRPPVRLRVIVTSSATRRALYNECDRAGLAARDDRSAREVRAGRAGAECRFPCVAALRLCGRPPHHRVAAGSANAPPAAAGADRERSLAERLRRRVRRGCASPRPAREPGTQGRQACDCAPPPSAAARARPPVPALAPGNDGLLIAGRARALIRRQMLLRRRERRRPPGVAGSPAEPAPAAARCAQSARQSSSHGEPSDRQ